LPPPRNAAAGNWGMPCPHPRSPGAGGRTLEAGFCPEIRSSWSGDYGMLARRNSTV
jgi:hypothetical protein